MTTFKEAINNTEVETTTTNGMKALKSSLNKNTDLFYKIGASRGRDIIPQFEAAYQEDRDIALRLAQWTRDVRGGAGERALYRSILKHLERVHTEDLLNTNILANTANIGRWDDLLIFENKEVVEKAFGLIARALSERNGLCAKWLPRKGPVAVALREYLGLSPKKYRKLLVNLTSVVETQMCNNDWDNINYSHVPSKAMSVYMKAFYKHSPLQIEEYRNALKSGDPKVKINASAVYPYEVIKTLAGSYSFYHKPEAAIIDLATAQWNAMPNYMGDAKILPMVDVSGSMTTHVAGSSKVMCLDVALSLGLYCADKNTGVFSDVILTFSAKPDLMTLKGDIYSKITQMNQGEWGMNTDIESAFKEVLRVAVKNNVPASEMPAYIAIFSDMQFDSCVKGYSALEMIANKYEEAGYQIPKIIFWNLNSHDNVPVRYDAKGTALVSGFSPALMKALLANDLETFTPMSVMLKTVMVERYDF